MRDPASADGAWTPEQLAQHTDTIVLDVRRKPDDAQIPGSRAFDSDALLADPELPADVPRDAPLVVYCGSGNTCRRVAEALRERGYDAHALDGGYRGWRAAGLPVEPRAAG
jgi:rhodanese-related sulfurtransferase